MFYHDLRAFHGLKYRSSAFCPSEDARYRPRAPLFWLLQLLMRFHFQTHSSALLTLLDLTSSRNSRSQDAREAEAEPAGSTDDYINAVVRGA